MIVVAGEALIDRMVHEDGRVQEAPGGGPYNVARTIARLCGDVAFMGRLSTDVRGERLRAALTADGVDLRWTATTDDPTTMAHATIDARGNASYTFDLAGTSSAGLDPALVGAALATGPAVVHLGTLGLVMEPVGTVLEDAVAEIPVGTLLVLDPNCRPATITDREAYVTRIGTLLRRTDVVKVSTDDLAYLSPTTGALAAARALLGAGARVVLMTDGAQAVHVLTGAFEHVLPVPKMPVVDTIGAGDSFGGGFVARWVERGRGRAGLGDGEALDDAVRYGIAVAGITCGRAGADPPTRDELDWPTD
jgi:fructokinase